MDAPEGLSPRGAALWEQLDKLLDLDGPAGILAHEAARIADRLEALDAAINARGSILERMHYRLKLDEFYPDDDHEPVLNVTVKVDAVLSEARQQQGRIAHLLAALGVELAKKPAAPPAPAAKKGTPLDELQAKRATRTTGGRAKSPARAPRGRQPR